MYLVEVAYLVVVAAFPPFPAAPTIPLPFVSTGYTRFCQWFRHQDTHLLLLSAMVRSIQVIVPLEKKDKVVSTVAHPTHTYTSNTHTCITQHTTHTHTHKVLSIVNGNPWVHNVFVLAGEDALMITFNTEG